mgnify:FL=1
MPTDSSEERELRELHKLGIGNKPARDRDEAVLRLGKEARRLGISVKDMKELMKESSENKQRTTRRGRGRRGRGKTRRKNFYKKRTPKRLNNAIKKFLTYKKRKFF